MPSTPATAPDDSPGSAPVTPPAAPAAPSTAVIEGSIALSGGDAEVTDTVVYFVPEAAEAPTPPENERAIVTRDKSLSPTVLTGPRGSAVRFPNEDPILHNLFSVSPGNDFDLGIYGPGEAPTVRFEQTGVVNIYCNVHHDMHAHVLVVDTPWSTRADASGRFRLEGLPLGPGQLHVWHRQSDAWSRAMRLSGDASVDVALDITKPGLPQHRDKTGQPYNRRDRDPYR